MERKYYVQDNSDVAHQDVRMYCNINQFPGLTFCGPHSKPHVARVFINHCHFRFDPKLGNGVCVQFAVYHVPMLHVHQC